MESKKLPVLWVDARNPILEDRHEHVISGLLLTVRPYQGNQEPYIPVARVRELMNEYGIRGEVTVVGLLKTLIADVEDDEN